MTDIDPIDSIAEGAARLSRAEVTPILHVWPEEQSLDESMVEVQKRVATEAMKEEVDTLCGLRYTHGSKRQRCYTRWGFTSMSIRIRSERYPLPVFGTCIRDRRSH